MRFPSAMIVYATHRGVDSSSNGAGRWFAALNNDVSFSSRVRYFVQCVFHQRWPFTQHTVELTRRRKCAFTVDMSTPRCVAQIRCLACATRLRKRISTN